MDEPSTQDLQDRLAEVATREGLAALLREVHLRAGKPSVHEMDKRTARAKGAVRLAKSTVFDMLRGRRFPSEQVMLAFLRECGGVDGDQAAPWKRAWERIAGDVTGQQPTELQAESAGAELPRPQEPMKSGERSERGGDHGQDGDPVRAGARLLTTRIIDGEPGHRPDDVLGLDVVMDQIRGSRALALDVLQLLQNRGMVTLETGVGAKVRPAQEWQWNLFDPEVMQRRLESELSSTQESLEELRLAVEPRAAFLAAQRASVDVRRRLIRLAVELKTWAEDPRFKDKDDSVACRRQFNAVDEQLHRTIINASGNDLFHALAEPVVKALHFRITRQWEGAKAEWELRAQQFANGNPLVDTRDGGAAKFPAERPELLAMWLHYGVVHAIEQRRSQAAETFARAIIAEYHGQLDEPLLRHALGLALCELNLSAFKETDRQPFFDAVEAVASPNRGAPPVERTAAPQET